MTTTQSSHPTVQIFIPSTLQPLLLERLEKNQDKHEQLHVIGFTHR